jgi:ADP-ribose pyrophosphatase
MFGDVPDKYVSWDVMFIAYDPIAYTKTKSEFPISLQQFADEDILLLQETQIEQIKLNLPVFEWNRISTNAAGITIDRSSWQISQDQNKVVYKLDNGIPRNPFGRTGLRGRGSLLRWGPNHYIMIVITRYRIRSIIKVRF